MKRILTLFLALLAATAVAQATPYTFLVQVDTPNFGGTGWIDFAFSKPNAVTALGATATVFNFQQTGFTLDPVTQTSGPGVTGSLDVPPVVIPNDEGADNFFTQHVTSWGSSFRFNVTFSGPAIGNSAIDGSTFRVTLYDENFGFLVSPLADGGVADISINPDGSLSAQGSIFDGGSATATDTPEPATIVLSGSVLAAFLVWRRRTLATPYN